MYIIEKNYVLNLCLYLFKLDVFSKVKYIYLYNMRYEI